MATRINNVVERFTLLGDDKSYSKTMKGAAHATDSTHVSMAKLGTVLRRVATGDVKGAKTAFGSLTKGMGGAALAGAAVGAAIVGGMATAVVAVQQVIGKYIELGKQVGQIGRITGMTGEESNSLRVQFKMLGLDVDASVKSLGKWGPSLYAARKGTGLQAEALAALGVGLKDSSGAWRSNADVLDEVRNKLSVLKKTDLAQYQGLSKAMFGKGFMSLDKWLQAAPAKIAKFQKLASTSGVDWSKDLTPLLEGSRQVSVIWDDIKATLGQKLVPLAERFMAVVIEQMPAIEESGAKIASALAPLGILFEKISSLQSAAPWLQDIADGLVAITAPTMSWSWVMDKTLTVIRAIRDTINQIATIALPNPFANFTLPSLPKLPSLPSLKLPNPLDWIPGLATGGYVPARAGGTIVRLAERGTGEYVVPESMVKASVTMPTPAQRVVQASAPVVNLHIGTVVGTDEAAARKLSEMVGRHLSRGIMRQMVGQNA